ncbi:uncharacterized protein LOC130614074 [Hydractinia symbiolongicarpus]|uniref:uncharacterized protein LOC130614074 n=1 Tax=Hydractinia symbiolongicarpus TaxID=13093 RepID=UPI00254C6FC3|nr:uncharacterized protein LOC130614074 [Hydractinia symbiolongicarpus]
MSRDIYNNMTLSAEVVDYIYNSSTKQSKSFIWHEIRVGRITASKVYDVLHTNLETPSESLIKRICKISSVVSTTVSSLRWGLDHEKHAVADFLKRSNHLNAKIVDCGLKLVPERTYIGATPDGIFTCDCHKEEKLIEIKCPYSYRNIVSFAAAVSDNKFVMNSEGKLKKEHRYYYQVQFQMFVFNCKSCFFIVWTPHWLHAVEVLFDVNFINLNTDKVEQFYLRHIIPELLTRRLERKVVKAPPPPPQANASEKLYCLCQTPIVLLLLVCRNYRRLLREPVPNCSMI